MTEKKANKPWITNISRDKLRDRRYERPEHPVTLIQIGNPNETINPPTHPEDFAVIHKFRYYPCFREQSRTENNLNESQAKLILTALKEAKDSSHHVIAQCDEGRVRSATLVDVAATLLDFDYWPGILYDPAWDDARLFGRVHTAETRYRIKFLTVRFAPGQRESPDKTASEVSELMIRQVASEILSLCKVLGERQCGDIASITKGAWFTSVNITEEAPGYASVLVHYNNHEWYVSAYEAAPLLTAQMSNMDTNAEINVTRVRVEL